MTALRAISIIIKYNNIICTTYKALQGTQYVRYTITSNSYKTCCYALCDSTDDTLFKTGRRGRFFDEPYGSGEKFYLFLQIDKKVLPLDLCNTMPYNSNTIQLYYTIPHSITLRGPHVAKIKLSNKPSYRLLLLHRIHELIYMYYDNKPLFLAQWYSDQNSTMPLHWTDGIVRCHYSNTEPIMAELVDTTLLPLSDRLQLHLNFLASLKPNNINYNNYTNQRHTNNKEQA